MQALHASLVDEQVSWNAELTPADWIELFQTAEMHHVLPMIYEAVYRCPSAQRMDRQLFAPFKRKTMSMVMLQTVKTSEFFRLLACLKESGVRPLVVKGIVCRNLYLKPDCRISGDEDILIPAEQFALCHRAMLRFGMLPADESADIQAAHEVSYQKPDSPLYIELHKYLFPPESEAYGDLNRFFEEVQSRAQEITIDGKSVSTMEETDHLFYLICHAFKHFLHSGFGIRQVCDIVLFANAYGSKIDWTRMLKQCCEIYAQLFAAALFKIGQIYLTFDPETACYPEEWSTIAVDEAMLLEDLLDAGVFGDGSMSRKHSSNITLNAVSAQKKGKRMGNSVLKTVFLPAKSMEGRYPYLKKHPYLLPAAWISRILKYRKETAQSKNNDAAGAVEIGRRRTELLRQYHIIDSE